MTKKFPSILVKLTLKEKEELIKFFTENPLPQRLSYAEYSSNDVSLLYFYLIDDSDIWGVPCCGFCSGFNGSSPDEMRLIKALKCFTVNQLYVCLGRKSKQIRKPAKSLAINSVLTVNFY